MIGRDDSCHITLPDASVSRTHARVQCAGNTVTVCDVNSRNGIKVNGVPRHHATLHEGDEVEVGIFVFVLVCGAGIPVPKQPSTLPDPAANPVDFEQTVRGGIRLPEQREERHLSAMYHAAYWLAECDDDTVLAQRMADLLRETYGAAEAQLYSPDLRLLCRSSAEPNQPTVKLADFLATRFQSLQEAAIVPGAEIARHQQKVGRFNYLAAPVKTGTSAQEPPPFVVIIRPAEWSDFCREDRVLLQAIAQLWAKGSNRAHDHAVLREQNRALQARAGTLPMLLGGSPAMERLRQLVAKAAASNVTVLVRGETGSGKEVVAHCLHAASARASKPFVRVNCGAIPDSLIESELFGHKKGAFTDAKESRRGKFAQADGGTIFLDEIGELPVQVQPKLLRVLENREIEPLGGSGAERVDVRVIAATHRDLKQMIREKVFREDLFHRLNVLTLDIPPLREHAEDIPSLARHFLEAFCMENGLGAMDFDEPALRLLQSHPWPGNVRELRNAIQRCAVLLGSGILRATDIQPLLEH